MFVIVFGLIGLFLLIANTGALAKVVDWLSDCFDKYMAKKEENDRRF